MFLCFNISCNTHLFLSCYVWALLLSVLLFFHEITLEEICFLIKPKAIAALKLGDLLFRICAFSVYSWLGFVLYCTCKCLCLSVSMYCLCKCYYTNNSEAWAAHTVIFTFYTSGLLKCIDSGCYCHKQRGAEGRWKGEEGGAIGKKNSWKGQRGKLRQKKRGSKARKRWEREHKDNEMQWT